MDELNEKIATYLSHVMPAAVGLEVANVSRIHGGASRETFRFSATWEEGGESRSRALILRRDPVASLIDTDRDVEFKAYQAFHPTGLPVPEPLFLETESKWLERPFFVMEQIEGCLAASPFAADPYGPLADKVGEQFWRHLGTIAKQDPAGIGFAQTSDYPAPTSCWKTALDYWDGEIDGDTLCPQPIVKGAIRWLRRNPPPPPSHIKVVHGDYRTGNFLYNEDGDIQAILDWEMCHLGDPLEDVAWAIDPLWGFNDPRPGSMIDRDRALALWSEHSGLELDPTALRWWEIFSAVKGLAIWISAAKEYDAGTNVDPILAFSSWYCTDFHNRQLVGWMQALIATEERT